MTDKKNVISVSSSDVYSVLADHQRQEQWRFKEVLKELHRWIAIFDFGLNLNVGSLTIKIDHLGRGKPSSFRNGHNGLGLASEITIDIGHIELNRSQEGWWRILGTLLKQMLHAWQHKNGNPPSTPGYHNKEYREKALSLGLVVEESGVLDYVADSDFLNLIGRFEGNVPVIPEPESTPRRKTGSKLALWICDCQPPVKVRIGRATFSAMCMVCESEFRKADT